ncbi:unnamed protein product, partial [Meganyctiphanes norvegica]
MAPQAPEPDVSGIILNQEAEDATEEQTLHINFKMIYHDLKHLDWSKVVWRNVILFAMLHVYAMYGAWLMLFMTQWRTLVWSYVMYFHAAIGITMGAHRLWAHRTYKARRPLRIYLMLCQTLAFQNSIHEWARDHRVHHRYSETDADPHNARRGFFFSHMGWLMYRKHPKVIEKGKTLDMSDLEADPVVMFQKRNYLWMVMLLCFVIPTVIPWYFWDESLVTALMVAGFLRYTIVLHFTWFVNSLAHWVGNKPFDKSIFPVQNGLVAFLAMGEGWHNYHHVFPWDYRTSELGGWLTNMLNFNFTTTIIDFFAKTGQVYDRKTITPEMWKRRMNRTGDGSYKENSAIKTE